MKPFTSMMIAALVASSSTALAQNRRMPPADDNDGPSRIVRPDREPEGANTQQGPTRPERGDRDDRNAPAMRVDPRSQLMITDLRVVEDRMRTDPRNGDRAPWSFRFLMENMAGNVDPSAFALKWLEHWEQDQEINGSVAPARPSIRELLIDPWLEASGGERLDLNRAPFKLLAIVNRMDLRQHEETEVLTAGEGRFIFGALAPDGTPLAPLFGTAPGGFVVIFEYELMARNVNELRDWTERWAALKQNPLGSPEYNRQLERVTRRFSERRSAPGKPNGNAIKQIRSNELCFGPIWELREFVIDGDTGLLRQGGVALTPDSIQMNGTVDFAEMINANTDAILGGSGSLAAELLAASSLSGPYLPFMFADFEDRTFTTNSFFEDFVDIPWSADGIVNNEARHALALQTCNGCHRDETGTQFLMVGFPLEHELPQKLARPAELAAFLTGTEVVDPVDGVTVREFNDLQRRAEDLDALIRSFGPENSFRGPQRAHRPKRVH